MTWEASVRGGFRLSEMARICLGNFGERRSWIVPYEKGVGGGGEGFRSINLFFHIRVLILGGK